MFARLLPGFVLCALAWTNTGHAQLQDRGTIDAVRVTVSINPDGSRTTYEFDPPNRKAVATTTTAEGKPQGKIRYDLDDAGRFATGAVFAADGKFRFKTRYKYDPAGRLLEETQLTKQDAVEHKIVYSYDPAGKQTGYAVYDSAGKLLGQTTPISPAPVPAKKKTK
jgi:YD repeat-containing protein